MAGGSRWHATRRTRQNLQLAARGALGFVLCALACYLPGTIPGTQPMPLLQNSYLPFAVMLVLGRNFGQTACAGVQSALGAAVAVALSMAIFLPIRLAPNGLHGWPPAAYLALGAILTFGMCWLLQYLPLEGGTQKIAIMLLSQSFTAMVQGLWAQSELAYVGYVDLGGVVIGVLVAMLVMLVPVPEMATWELGHKLKLAMRELSYAHLLCSMQHLQQEVPIQPGASSDMIKMFGEKQLSEAGGNIKELEALFGEMWWEPGQSKAARQFLRSIINLQRAGFDWLCGMQEVASRLPAQAKDGRPCHLPVSASHTEELRSASAEAVDLVAQSVSRVLSMPTGGCGLKASQQSVASEMDGRIGHALRKLHQAKANIHMDVSQARLGRAKEVSTDEMEEDPEARGRLEAIMFFSANYVASVLKSLHACQSYLRTVETAGANWNPLAAMTNAFAKVKPLTWPGRAMGWLRENWVLNARMRIGIRVGVAMTLAHIDAILVPEVGVKVSFQTAMLIAGAKPYQCGNIRTAVLRIVGAMMAVNIPSLIIVQISGSDVDGWVIAVIVGAVWIYGTKYYQFADSQNSYAFKMATLASQGVLINYGFYVADPDAAFSSFAFVVLEVVHAAVIVIVCEVAIFPMTGQRLVLRSLKQTLISANGLCAVLKDSMCQESEAVPRQAGSGDGEAHALTSGLLMDGKGGIGSGGSQLLNLAVASIDSMQSTAGPGPSAVEPAALQLPQGSVVVDPARFRYAEGGRLASQLRAHSADLRSKAQALANEPAFGQFVPPAEAFLEVEPALSKLSGWCGLYCSTREAGRLLAAADPSCHQLHPPVAHLETLLNTLSAAIDAILTNWSICRDGRFVWHKGSADEISATYRAETLLVVPACNSLKDGAAATREALLAEASQQPRQAAGTGSDVMQETTAAMVLSSSAFCLLGMWDAAVTLTASLLRLKQTYTSFHLQQIEQRADHHLLSMSGLDMAIDVGVGAGSGGSHSAVDPAVDDRAEGSPIAKPGGGRVELQGQQKQPRDGEPGRTRQLSPSNAFAQE